MTLFVPRSFGGTLILPITIPVLSYYPTSILAGTPAPTAYYRVNEVSGNSATDLTGNGYTATYSGSYTQGVAGLIANGDDLATTLNGATGTFTLPYSLNISSCTSLSYEFWVNTGSGRNFIAVTCNGTTTLLYQNGSLVSSGTGASLFIGIQDGIGATGSMTLDEFAIWRNTVLSAGKIAADWIAGNTWAFSESVSPSETIALQTVLSLPADILTPTDSFFFRVPGPIGFAGLPQAFPGAGFAGLGVLPLTSPPLLPYAVNGIVLPTQPTTMTAPLDTTQVIRAGTVFYLAFMNPGSLTLSALSNGNIVTLQFGLQNGYSVSGPVLLASTMIGSFFQVTCTVTQDIPIYRWVIQTQFS